MRVKNNKQSSDIWCGQTIASTATYDIQSVELANWQMSDKVVTDLMSGDLSIGDGSTYAAAGAAAVAFLMGVDSTPKDNNGRPIVRGAAASAGWRAEFHTMRVTTSTGVVSKKRDGSDTGFCTFTMYDANGDVTQTSANAVQSVVRWEPTYNIEIVGATAMQAEPPTVDIWLHVTNAPDIPAQYGGSVEFAIGGINLADVGIGGIADFDGRASKLIAYDAQNHSGAWEFMFKHPAGTVHSMTIIMELFRA